MAPVGDLQRLVIAWRSYDSDHVPVTLVSTARSRDRIEMILVFAWRSPSEPGDFPSSSTLEVVAGIFPEKANRASVWVKFPADPGVAHGLRFSRDPDSDP